MRTAFLKAMSVIVGLTTLAVVVAETLPSSPAPVAGAAQADYFLKLEGVEGEADDKQHKGEIEIQSFSWGVSQKRDASSGQATGKALFDGIKFKKQLDKSSPILFRSVPEGKMYKSAVLTAIDENSNQYLRVSFFDVFVVDYSEMGDAGASPMDSFSLSYGKIVFEYFPVGAGGGAGAVVVRGWDVKANKGI